MIQYGFFIFVLSPHASAMSRIFVLDLGRGSLMTNTGGGSSGGARGAWPPPPYFYTKMRPEGQKKIDRTAPPLSQGLDDRPPPLSEGLDPPLNT